MYLITLRKNRNDETLKSPFFKLMFSLGIADVGMMFTLLLGRDLAASGLVPEVFIFLSSLSARFFNIGAYGFASAQNFGVLFVALNRFTAYLVPLKHSLVNISLGYVRSGGRVTIFLRFGGQNNVGTYSKK
jgi:hypothetical protein